MAKFNFNSTFVYTTKCPVLRLGSNSRGLLFVSDGFLPSKDYLLCYYCILLLTCPWAHGNPILFLGVFKANKCGLHAHQSHSIFEIFMPGNRKVLFFRSQGRKSSILKISIRPGAEIHAYNPRNLGDQGGRIT